MPSHHPARRHLRVVAAVGAGANGVAQVGAQLGMDPLDPADRVPDPPRYAGAGPFGWVADAPWPAAQPVRAGQLRDDRLAFGPGPVRGVSAAQGLG